MTKLSKRLRRKWARQIEVLRLWLMIQNAKWYNDIMAKVENLNFAE